MYTSYHQRIAGISLIELLISVSLGAILVSIIMSIYVSGTHSYQLQKQLAEIQSDARAVIAILNHEIQMAGHVGCLRLNFPISEYQPYSLTTKNRLWENSSGELTIKYMSYPNAVLNQQTDYTLETNRAMRFKAGDILLISDCERAEIFKAKFVLDKAEKQIIVLSSPLKYQYHLASEIGKLTENTFFVAPSKRTDNKTIYSLYLRDINRRTVELLEGIDQLKFYYTVGDTNLTAMNISDWSKIRGVNVDFRMTKGLLKKTWHSYASIYGA